MSIRSHLAVIATGILLTGGTNPGYCQEPTWEKTQGPSGGFVQSLAFLGDSTVFVGTGNIGIFRSTDRGTSWTHAGLTTIGITTLFVDSSNNVFAGSRNYGLSRSTDKGLSWSQVGLTFLTIHGLASDSAHSLYAATDRGVFRSIDGGTSWVAATNSPGDTIALSIGVGPGNSIFCGTKEEGLFVSTNAGEGWNKTSLPASTVWSISIDTETRVLAGTSEGIFRSTDVGASWTKVNDGVMDSSARGFAVQPNGFIFAVTSPAYLLRSTDGGDTWIAFEEPANAPIRCVAVSPDSFLYAATYGDGVFRAPLDLDSWNQVYFFQPGINSLLELPNGHLFAGTPNFGVFRSTDRGSSWHSSSTGMTDFYVYTLAASPTGMIFAGTGSSLYYSSDNGTTWTKSGMRWGVRRLVVTSGGPIIAAATSSIGLFRSTDGGINWASASEPLAGGASALLETSGGTILAGLNIGGVLRSTDGGGTWVDANQGMGGMRVWSLALDSSEAIFAGTLLNGVYRSTDDGMTWASINNGLTVPLVRDLIVVQHGELYASTEDSQPEDSTHNPFHARFTNSGELNAGSRIGRVFRTTNRGESWVELQSWPNHEIIRTFAFGRDGYLFAGTENQGVFRTSQPIITSFTESRSVPLLFHLYQSYPNPFNPETAIRFTLPKEALVTLKVYDLLGRLVVTLVDDVRQAGEHQVNFRADNLPSGVYLYRLESGDKFLVQKMTVMR